MGMAATMSAAGIGAARRAPPLRARAGGARARSPPLPPPAAPRVRRSARVRAGARDDTDVEELPAGAAEADATDGAQSTELLLWVGGAALFGAGIFAVQGADPAAEFFAGYVLEQALSVDNLFVFILVFSYFKVPPAAQEVALKYGIVGAAVLRGVFVLAGAAVLERFEGALGVFALILIYSSYKLLTEEEDEDESLEDNALVKLCSKCVLCSSYVCVPALVSCHALTSRDLPPCITLSAPTSIAGISTQCRSSTAPNSSLRCPTAHARPRHCCSQPL